VLGTSLAAGVVPTFISAQSYYRGGNVAVKSVPAIAIGAAVGAVCGSRIAMYMSEDTLRLSFSAGMIVLGLRVLLSARK